MRDPVCGMVVDPLKTKHSAATGGASYYFCSAGCREKFLANPRGYPTQPEKSAPLHRPVSAPSAQAQSYVCPMCPEVRESAPRPCPHCGMSLEPEGPAASPTQYTCPMHQQIVRSAPGDCPICGMALEPRSAGVAGDGANPELADMTRRLWVSVLLTVPLLVVDMGGMLPNFARLNRFSPYAISWIEAALATPVVLWGGWPFFKRGWASIANRYTNMFTLIAMGTGAAYLYSLAVIVRPQAFPMLVAGAMPPVYFEAAAVITTLVLVGQVLELRARSRTGAAIRTLFDLTPKIAHVLRFSPGEPGSTGGAVEVNIPLTQVASGDRLRVRPGEKIPVDGVVLEGQSSVDE
ncbi:MAG: YHS domain-containing protein, partial [Acidobacteriales bacterium]|nr:YHS domain-containing protein [Terriglobales bacterium]